MSSELRGYQPSHSILRYLFGFRSHGLLDFSSAGITVGTTQYQPRRTRSSTLQNDPPTLAARKSLQSQVVTHPSTNRAQHWITLSSIINRIPIVIGYAQRFASRSLLHIVETHSSDTEMPLDFKISLSELTATTNN